MKRAGVCFLLVVALVGVAFAETGAWSSWISAKNATQRDQYGFEHQMTDFSYRWRHRTPCSGKNCFFDLQIRNNSEGRVSVSYIIETESEEGKVDSYKDHRNFDPRETQDVPVGGLQGKQITQVTIQKN